MKRILLGLLAGVMAVVCIAGAGPAAASAGTARPLVAHPDNAVYLNNAVHPNILGDCFMTASAPSVSGGIVTFETDTYCETIVDFVQVDVTLTALVGGAARPIAGNSCMDASTSQIFCSASAYCQGANYYGGYADFTETNSVGVSTGGSWNQPPIWVGC